MNGDALPIATATSLFDTQNSDFRFLHGLGRYASVIASAAIVLINAHMPGKGMGREPNQ
jgi:hypothetical protein